MSISAIGYIYSLVNIVNDKRYVGQTIDLDRRIREHFWNCKDILLIDKAINQYGKDNFIVELLEVCKEEKLNEREVYWINYFDTYSRDGYNCHVGGDAKRGEYNPMYGKNHSKQTIAKIRKSKTKVDKNLGEKIYNEYWDNDISQKELVSKYNLSKSVISKVVNCKHKSTKHLEKKEPKDYHTNSEINKDTGIAVYKNHHENNLSYKELMKKYDLSYSTVSKMSRGVHWSTKDIKD